MKEKHPYTEPLSTILRRQPEGGHAEITNTLQWVAYTSLFVFLTWLASFLLTSSYINALATAIGIIPIIVSIILIRRGGISAPSVILAVTIILLITWLATLSQGIYDISVLGYPVILIAAGLILRGRVIMYLTFLIILCMAWLVFGDIYHLYEPVVLAHANPQDFFIAGIIMLIAGNVVYRLVRNVYKNLYRAEQEIEMRKKAEQDREALIQQLKAKNQELDRFAVKVSHDLKTPLITVAGFLGYLDKDLKEGDHERVEKDLSQINDAAKTMGKFVDELLDLSRIGRITNPPRAVPFDEIVQGVLKATDGLIKARRVQVEIDADLPSVYVDRARIVQVMQNLITNGVKFMGDQPQPMIKIGFENKDGEHTFFVSDNGIGIAREHHERIFELFNKLDPTTDGTGIGLGVVKRIIEMHGGKIWVESEPGKGTTFFFTLENRKQEEML